MKGWRRAASWELKNKQEGRQMETAGINNACVDFSHEEGFGD